MTRRKFHLLMAAPMLAAAIAGCSAENGGNPTTSPNPNNTPKYSVDYDQDRLYHSIAELTRDSDLVIRAQGTGSTDAVTIDGLPVVNTHFEVVEAIRGTAPKEIAVSQFGVPGTRGHLDKERSYLLFLKASTEAPDRYGIVGTEAGIYLESSGKATLMDTDQEASDLPKEMKVEDLRAEILRASQATMAPQTAAPQTAAPQTTGAG